MQEQSIWAVPPFVLNNAFVQRVTDTQDPAQTDLLLELLPVFRWGAQPAGLPAKTSPGRDSGSLDCKDTAQLPKPGRF